jgi:hypothetical protein
MIHDVVHTLTYNIIHHKLNVSLNNISLGILILIHNIQHT